MIIPKGPYQRTYERLFKEARGLFNRLRTDGPEMYVDHLRLSEKLSDSFDYCDRLNGGLLDSLCSEIHSTILSFPQDKRENASKKIYNRLRAGGYISGAKYQHLDREARKFFKYYAGIVHTIYIMKEVLDWLYHYSNTVARWWVAPRRYKTNEGRFSKYYQPKTTRESVAKYLKKDTPSEVKTRLIGRLYGMIKDENGRNHLRSSSEWEAICIIIYNSEYFKDPRKMVGHNKRGYFKWWSSIFCNLLEIPPFTQRPGNNEVKAKVAELLKGEFDFLPQSQKFYKSLI